LRLSELIYRFSRKRIVVVGDLMLDRFVWGKVNRISPEAPVPVVDVDSETCIPGGAANVAHNLQGLEAKVSLVGVVGDDDEGRILVEELMREGAETCGVAVDPKRPTTLKTRVVAHGQHVVRFDRELTEKVSPKITRRLLELTGKAIDKADAVVLSDYGKGVMTPKLIKEVIKQARNKGVPVVADPKLEYFWDYKNVTVISPNKHEACRITGMYDTDEASIRKAGKRLLGRLKCEAVLITRGEDGMDLFTKKAVTNIPSIAHEVYDVTGAGDTVTAVFAASLAAGATMEDAARIANCAAGIVVGKVGTAVVSLDELRGSLIGIAYE